MKRKSLIIFLILLVILTCVVLVGCTDTDNTTDNKYENSSENVGNNGNENNNNTENNENMENKIFFTIGETTIEATLVDNSATQALLEKLKEKSITIEMHDYGGWEKVGSFGFSLPTSNKQITAEPCEFVLYQGNQLVIFYGSNNWSYTKLGKFDNITQSELKKLLGTGDVTVTISLS